MSFRPFNNNVSIVAFEKNNQRYAMTVAWATQVGYDYIVLLLGSQSETGQAISKGDLIGVSVLSKAQKDIATQIGETHSTKFDKLKDVSLHEFGMAYTIKNSVCEMCAEVVDVLHLDGIEDDNLVYAKVVKYTTSGNDYLTMGDFDD